MKRTILYVVLAFIVAPIFVSCYQSHKKELDLAYALVEYRPDSALTLMKHIDQEGLSKEEMAKYALIYYMVQDKSSTKHRANLLGAPHTNHTLYESRNRYLHPSPTYLVPYNK